MSILNKILSLLPFNGDKTKLGVILGLITTVQAIAGDPQAHLLLQAITAAVTIGVGLFHKYVKTAAPSA